VQAASSPLKLAKVLDQCQNEQGGDCVCQNLVSNKTIATESVISDRISVDINSVKLLLETLVAGQV
jgi:hypothetical protein